MPLKSLSTPCNRVLKRLSVRRTVLASKRLLTLSPGEKTPPETDSKQKNTDYSILPNYKPPSRYQYSSNKPPIKHTPQVINANTIKLYVNSLDARQRRLLLLEINDWDALHDDEKQQIEKVTCAMKVFNVIDNNDDGVLTKTEFIRWYRWYVTEQGSKEESTSKEVTPEQYRQYLFRMGVPFFAFGFMDNGLMIIFGEAIDVHLTHQLGLSLMFSAALGNVFADICGVGFGDAVERTLSKLGLKDPRLNHHQMNLPHVRKGRTFASLLGIGTGCLCGMAPLVFF